MLYIIHKDTTVYGTKNVLTNAVDAFQTNVGKLM